eukprot:TRINITY_DN2797_c0_g1_i11.p1 TRINITY_DN2797_c0_g1~~TRINITY_DN2797_c0_g1_i11.p1  ORF type:complete len:137 (-),score=66.01 TRINITY_DN2797_c0_g1_i11:13-399(-)
MCIRDSINAEYMGNNLQLKICMQETKNLLNQSTNDALNIPKFETHSESKQENIEEEKKPLMAVYTPEFDKNSLSAFHPLKFEQHASISQEQSLTGLKRTRTKSLLSTCLLYTSPSPRDLSTSRMPSSA